MTTSTNDDDGLGVPGFLKVANRTPLSAELKKRVLLSAAGARVQQDGAANMDRPKGFDPNEPATAKILAEVEHEKAAKVVRRIDALRLSKGLPPVKRKGQLPLPPRKGAHLPTPRAPTPSILPGWPPAPHVAKTAPTGPATAMPANTEASTMTKSKTSKTKKSRPVKGAKAKRTTRAAAGNGVGPRPGSKTEIVANLLRREKGCTTADVLAATGWPAVSMPAMAKAARLKLSKGKVDGVTRYRGA